MTSLRDISLGMPARAETCLEWLPVPPEVAHEHASEHPLSVLRNPHYETTPLSVETITLLAGLVATAAPTINDVELLAYRSTDPAGLLAYQNLSPELVLAGAVRNPHATRTDIDALCAAVERAAHGQGDRLGIALMSTRVPPDTRHALMSRTPYPVRVGYVNTEEGHDSGLDVLWPHANPAWVEPGVYEYAALAALTRTRPELATLVGQAACTDLGLPTLTVAAILCALEVWTVNTELEQELCDRMRSYAKLTPQQRGVLPRGRGASAPPPELEAQIVALYAHSSPGYPNSVTTPVRAAIDTGLSVRGDIAAVHTAADNLAVAFTVRGATRSSTWEPYSDLTVPDGLATPQPALISAAVDAMGTNPVAWRLCLELADGTMSYDDLFALASTLA